MIENLCSVIVDNSEQTDPYSIAQEGIAYGMGVAIWFIIWMIRQNEEIDPRELIDSAVDDFEANLEAATKPYRKETEH